ncbi:MAG: cation:proton antiporter [Thermoplasmata archaeon]
MDIVSALGVLLFLSFLGSYLMEYFGQSTVLAYIIIGIFIGPYIDLRPLGIPYTGLIQNTSILSMFGNIGLIFIFFFIGLNFSFRKLSKYKTPSIIIGIFDVSINMIAGIAIGLIFHWPVLDTLFLASIIAMSSTAITVKAIEDLKRLTTPETELMISIMIVEDFLSVLILTILSSSYLTTIKSINLAIFESFGIITLIAFYMILTFIFIPTIKNKIVKRSSDEVVVMFIVGIVMLSGSLSAFFSISPIIGAFFIGMALAETDLSKLVESKVRPIGFLFISLFFIYIGTLINPFSITSLIPIIIASLFAIFIVELIIVSSLVFLLGYTSSISTSVGIGLLPRNEESFVYASLGSTLKSNSEPLLTNGSLLFPIAGIISLVTTIITPIFIKFSKKIAYFLSFLVPKSVKWSAGIISKTMKIALSNTTYIKKGNVYMMAFPPILNMAILISAFYFHSFFILPLILISLIVDFYMFKTGLIEISSRVYYEGIKSKKSALLYSSYVLTFFSSTIYLPILFLGKNSDLILFASIFAVLFIYVSFIIFYKLEHIEKFSKMQ